jgi:hypothetical protein
VALARPTSQTNRLVVACGDDELAVGSEGDGAAQLVWLRRARRVEPLYSAQTRSMVSWLAETAVSRLADTATARTERSWPIRMR